MKTEKAFITIVSAVCALLACFAAGVIIYLQFENPELNSFLLLAKTILVPAFAAAVFILVGHFSPSNKYILLVLSGLILLTGIVITPYAPCNDSLDMHHILEQLLEKNGVGIYYRTYMNCTINNKLTAYCYLPFVLLLKNVVWGVRCLNALLLTGTVIFSAFSAKRILKIDGVEKPLFILSLIAPYMLLSGPYIYLPSLFLAGAAVFFYTYPKIWGRLIFIFFAVLLYILRPTCFGFLIVFIILDTFFNLQHKRYFLKGLLTTALVVVCCFAGKGFTGTILYKTHLHRYPNMQNNAAVWTLELGTRSHDNPLDTGTCFYVQYDSNDSYDEIQKDFHNLYLMYYNDEMNDTDSYEEIKAFQEEIKQKIIDRVKNEDRSETWKRLLEKTHTFFRNLYIPYYYMQNVTNPHFTIWKDYDRRYFTYQNSILLLFFAAMIFNLIRVIKNKEKINGALTALGAGAIAINVVLILLTEVSKKYMFDFFVPMALCIVMSVNYSGKNRIKPPWAPMIIVAAIIISMLYERTQDIDIFLGANTHIVKRDDMYIMTVNMREECDDDYSVKTYDGNMIDLKGKSHFTLTFPEDTFDSFVLFTPEGEMHRFSSQTI